MRRVLKQLRAKASIWWARVRGVPVASQSSICTTAWEVVPFAFSVDWYEADVTNLVKPGGLAAKRSTV